MVRMGCLDTWHVDVAPAGLVCVAWDWIDFDAQPFTHIYVLTGP